MADDAKPSFPVIPIKHWWALRERFKRSLPAAVTSDYLEAALGINEKSAPDIIPALKQMGLVTADGKTTDRAEQWRHDDTYPAACKAIVDDVYPSELKDAVPDPAQDRDAVKRWFARKTKTGDVASGKMTACYLVLMEADPAQAPESSKTATTPAGQPKKAARTSGRSAAQPPVLTTVTPPPSAPPKAPQEPNLHIDIQIHIPPDSTAEQLDRIFESMAKHLYKRSV